jgi:hypothetical protein
MRDFILKSHWIMLDLALITNYTIAPCDWTTAMKQIKTAEKSRSINYIRPAA